MIVAKKIVRDHLQENKVNISSYNVPNKLVLSCNSAHARYKASLQEKANEAKKSVQKEKRELFQEELNELINKEKKLIGTCDSLDDDFVKLIGDAERRPEQMSTLVTKANALKRRQNELRKEVKGLQKEKEGKRLKLY